MIVYACLTPWKRKQSSTILMFFWVLCTDPSSNKCVWHLWVADNPNLLESFHFKFSLMEFSCKRQKTSSQFSLPHMSVSIWKNRCVQDVSCPPWKWVGVGLHPTDHGLVCRGRGGCWPRAAVPDGPDLLRAPVAGGTCRSPLCPLCRCYTLTTQWIKCVLYSVDRRLRVMFPCSPAPFKGLSRFKKYQSDFRWPTQNQNQTRALGMHF